MPLKPGTAKEQTIISITM